MPFSDQRKLTVLFVDDDLAVLDSLRLFFAFASVEARSAMSGDEAIAHVFGGFRPDVIISDYRLPNERRPEGACPVEGCPTASRPLRL